MSCTHLAVVCNTGFPYVQKYTSNKKKILKHLTRFESYVVDVQATDADDDCVDVDGDDDGDDTDDVDADDNGDETLVDLNR